jgi:cytochrome c-type biogenesis protein CcmH/NrfG
MVMALLLVFGPVVHYDFVVWDDDLHVYANPYLTPVSWSHLGTFWRAPYEHLYIPLTYTTWAAVAWMMQAGPTDLMIAAPFHSLNLLLHIGSVLVVSRIVGMLLQPLGTPDRHTALAAAWGALIFGLHPLQVEVVAWVSGLKDLLCGWWVVIALWQYLAFVQCQPSRKKALHYGFATGAFGLALLAKPAAVMTPVMAGILAIGGLGQTWPQALRALGGWLLIALAWSVWTKTQQPDVALTVVTSLWTRPVIALDSITFYLGKLFWPADLIPDYGRTPQWVLAQGGGLVTALVPLGLGALLWHWRARCQALCLASGAFLAGLTPVLGLVPFMFQSYSTVADRYAYLSLVGVAFGVGWIGQHFRRWPGVLIGGALLISLLAWRSTQQVPIWRDTTALFTHTLRVNPQSAMAHNNLGLTLAQEGRLQEALASFQTAVQLRPDLAEAHYNLGKAFTLLGKFDAALPHHTAALQYRPGWAEAHNNFGATLAAQGQHTEALTQYATALVLKPGWVDVYYNMGQLFMQQSRYGEARVAYRAALQSRSVHLPAAIGLAQLLANHFTASLEATREAVDLAEQVCRVTEYHHPTAVYTLALAYHAAGQFSDAIRTADQALTLAVASGNPSLVQDISTLLVASQQGASAYEVP